MFMMLLLFSYLLRRIAAAAVELMDDTRPTGPHAHFRTS